MKFALAKEHRDYFESHQYLELEGLLSPAQLSDTLVAVDAVLLARPQEKQVGRDLWRDNTVLQRLVRHEKFVAMAAELTHQRMLRLVYDHHLVVPIRNPLFSFDPFEEARFIADKETLSSGSCIQGLVCGLLLCIDGEAQPSEEGVVDFFPRKPGHGVFFSAQVPIDLSLLERHSGQRFLLITYAQRNSVYVFREKDPHVHLLKDLGYSFGDRLVDRLHPIVYRYTAI
jgi:hypothetical protein